MKNGDIALLENIRFHPEEEANDPKFSKALAELEIFSLMTLLRLAIEHTLQQPELRNICLLTPDCLLKRKLKILLR